MKIVILDGYAANPGDLSWDELKKLGDLTVYEYTGPDETIARIGDAEMVLTNKTLITEAVMEACPQMKYVGVLATGYNIVDCKEAAKRGIIVTNVPAYSSEAVAQMVFALLLEICHHVGHHSDAIHAGRWSANRDFCFWDYPLIELSGKTMGIIGFGQIGKITAKIAEAFGMKVLAASHTPREGLASLDEVLAKSDVISLHCPLTSENAGMINRDTIAKMKDGVILINTARGGLINETDLREALLSGKIYAAAADVVSTEPIPADSPLLGLPNMIMTPHIAWAPVESRRRLLNIAIQNATAYVNGKPVNKVCG